MARFHWSLANYSDLTNKPDRTFNQTKLNTLEAKLKNATDDNKSVLDLAPEDLDVATLSAGLVDALINNVG